MTLLALVALAIWLGLAATGFWTGRENDERAAVAAPPAWPDVVTVVPARDEADVIAASIASLLAQDYPGTLRIVLVDDASTDGTAIAAGVAAGADPRLTVLAGAPLPAGWTGKLWALHQGIAAAGDAPWLWLTDADIAHAPDTLTRLVGIAQAGDRRLVSLMARLHCGTWPERAAVPAFVYFFMMLYPFARVNRPGRMAGAAGGCVLVEAAALARAGGIAAMRGALIDDCTLARRIKAEGPIWLGLTRRSRSLRPYRNARAIGAMIARSAYAQLRFDPLLLAGTVLGLALVFVVPPAAAFAPGIARWLGLAAWAVMALTMQPVLRLYARSPLWGVALPLVALFYAGCTVQSAWAYYAGRGGMWKGRVAAPARA